MHVVGGQGPTKRLVVVADNSLIVEAIAIGLRKSGAFKLLGHVNARTGSIQAIVEAEPDVVLVDDLDGSEESVELVAKIKAAQARRGGDRAVHLDGSGLARRDLRRRRGRCDLQGDPSRFARHAGSRDDRGARGPRVQELRCRARPARARGREQTPLTSRELEVLQLVAGGATNGEIAQKLWVTEQTVKFHLSNVYRKLEVGNRTEASHYAHVKGLVPAAEPAVASLIPSVMEAGDAIWRRVQELVCATSSVDALRHHGVELIAARAWSGQGRPVPDELRLDERIAAIRTLGVPVLLRRIREAYDGTLIFMKGPEAAARYPDPALRQFCDLDFLVDDAGGGSPSADGRGLRGGGGACTL